MRPTGIFRWRAIGPLILLVAAVWTAAYLLLDPTARRSVERFGTEIVGARVELDAADVRLADGVVYLRRLQVTNPDRPMTNLFEADEIVANFRVVPLLEKKVVIDTVAVRGLRFGTPRETSGAVDRPSRTSAEVRREIADWRQRLRLPEFSLAGLGQVVDVGAINAESLTTLRRARGLLRGADSTRQAWTARLDQLNPRPVIDSARALVTRLQGASVTSLGLAGARDAVTSARNTVSRLTTLDNTLAEFERGITSEVANTRRGLEGVVQARADDLAYARRLLKLPSLDGPNLGPALFGSAAADQIAPYLYWFGMAERAMPPGVRARLRQGKDRTRRSGTTVVFPRREHLPRFLLGFAEATVAIAGSGAGAGNYGLHLTDLTNAPALVGRPATFLLQRTEGRVGPETVRVAGVLNHVGAPIRDSVAALIGGIGLPTLRLAAVGADLHLGRGTTELAFARVGDSVEARWRWSSQGVRWDRLTGAGPSDTTAPSTGQTAAAIGQALGRSAQDIAWRAISRLDAVEVDARLSGPISRPRLSVGSNVAQALANAVREELGAEVQRAEQLIRARVDSLVQLQVMRARDAVDGFTAQVADRVADRRREVDRVKADLEAQVRRLTGGLPIGTDG